MEDTDNVGVSNFTARVPPALLRKLDAEADREQRSRNGQLIRILEERYASAVIADRATEEVRA